ncbi:hypothetical protein AV530_016317 [Patagioenas fasciata monilis]|uniref:Ig-like domain-containing protein n=1 Tax=Patagioenas fasciata monilis TaxID=372326 RepID=A0A1V4KWD8_PATFA|nr:hypothetical protein AV530_016317 [Patagioenas fasciata monilis]
MSLRPQTCRTVHGRMIKSVVCHRKRLTSIPEGIPTETKILELNKNRIRCLNPGDLSPYPLLEELDFSENIISNVEPGAFSNLFNLQTLRLRGNQLKLIPPGVFTKLTNLTLLDISENKLVILLDYMFQDLRNLKSLEVGDNDLVYISQRAFSGLLGLEQLTIEKCNLTSISAESLSYLQNLEVLRLRHLSISALEDQNFKKLYNLLQLEIDNWPLLEDVSPTSFQGLNLTSLSITYTNITAVPAAALRNLVYLRQIRLLNLSSNFLSTLEESTFHSRRKTLNFDGQQPMCSSPPEIQGNALRDFPDSVLFEYFTCQKPKIRDRKLQHHRMITTRSTGRATVLPGGTLEIRFAQVQDSGTYICIASNAGGNDTYFATLTFTLDLKTILVSTAMGCITFLGVVDGPTTTTGQGGARKFNMKMI